MTNKSRRLHELFINGFDDVVLPLRIISRSELSEKQLGKFASELNVTRFVVRSSANDEDQEFSNAGKYLSIVNVEKDDLYAAAQKVFESYLNFGPDEQVFIQPYLNNVTRSGVVFTKDPNTGGNYLVINSVLGEDTTIVTSGYQNGRLEVIYRKQTTDTNNPVIERNQKLIDLVNRVLNFYGEVPLDIEFAETRDSIYLLQVRPLAVKLGKLEGSYHANSLIQIQNLINEIQKRSPFLLGDTTYFGIMPDWNPAELIGVRPTQLAISLFKELITDGIWAYERKNLGYRNVRSFPLLVEFAGQPYIDVRASFNSLVPANLNDHTAEKLINYYLRRLRENPHLDDKIESEIVLSAYTFDLDAKLSNMPEQFSQEEKQDLKQNLIQMTRSMILSEPYGLQQILKKSQPLNERFQQLISSSFSAESKIYWLIEDCKRHGTLPFAGAARLAFVATSMINSLISVGVLEEKEVEDLFKTLNTVTGEMLNDWSSLSIHDFVEKYGHLRPGTFDIRNPSYKDNIDLYFEKVEIQDFDRNLHTTRFSNLVTKISQSSALDDLGISSIDFLTFVTNSVKAREEIKFFYSRNISMVLDLIAEVSSSLGISRDDAAHFKIDTFLDAYRKSLDLKEQLDQDVTKSIVEYEITSQTWLPPLILSSEDVFAFDVQGSHPNFITQRSIHGDLIDLSTGRIGLEGKIILVERADPGFDWIFTKKIAGFITCYGGANSHMAVRAKELNIPAAIGVGLQIYQKLQSSRTVFLDCINRRIEMQ
jgi:phosphohistidine swiveling domain-containing protein